MRLRTALAALLAGAAPLAMACLWDSDTLAMERQRFPSALELITGKFLRHTPEFYEWRIRDRLARIKSEPGNLALHDDLAVAYDKTGQYGKAIELTLAIRDKAPRRYETEANLGSFYLHNGDTEKGLRHLALALEINPQAHFGREKYQKLLAEYVADRRRATPKGEPLLPLRRENFDFSAWLKLARWQPTLGEIEKNPELAKETTEPRRPFGISPESVAAPASRAEETAAAIKGVLGMMKFGNFESPMLLEALGDLLSMGAVEGGPHNLQQNAGRMAARAYLKASMHATEPGAREAYRDLAKRLVTTHQEWSFERLESEFSAELTDARAWYATLAENERTWIREGKDADAEFARTYYGEPTAIDGTPWHDRWGAADVVTATIIGVLIWLIWVAWKRRAARAGKAASANV